MKSKKIAALLCVVAMLCCLFASCGTDSEAEGNDTQDEVSTDPSDTLTDQEKADNVAALIDAIYVQQWTQETEAQCIAAKEAWDALTDEQKELVQGEHADPDYFGADTGDASKDDPRNADGIGENELLVVSFGTSFNETRVADIKAVEDALEGAYPDWTVRRAFTSQIIINHIFARDGESIDNVKQALERAIANGVKNLVVQPTHLMKGAEYTELIETLAEYEDKFETVKVAEPLLGDVGSDASIINADKEAVAIALTAEAVSDAGYESLEAAKEDSVAFVFMGHGTSHSAKVTYSQMQTQMDELGYENVFIGTVEGEPEGTACEDIIEAIAQAGYEKVVLRPMMVVAGDHANNDMAGEDEDSWLSMFTESGEFSGIETQISGLGRIEAIQDIYIAHTAGVIGSGPSAAALEDGVYTVNFDTDSSMFHVNEALDGKGTLTVENGVMTVHISLVSKSIVNLFPGLAEDAGQDGAAILEPTTDSVTYSDGTTEEVYGFDVPVPALDEEFDLAILGTKGTWYDHKVSVSNPVAAE